MRYCFECGKKAIEGHYICDRCARNPFLNEKYRKFLAANREKKAFLDTYTNKVFANFGNINSGEMWDFLIKYHRYYEAKNRITRLRIRRILEKIPRDTNLFILDIGFGYGDVLLNLEREGFQNLSGIDLSRRAVEYIKEKIPSGSFISGDFLNMTLKNNAFDIIIASEIMEHIPVKSTYKAYEVISKALKEDGKVIFTVPLNENLETVTFRCPHGSLVNPNGHVREYTKDVMELELQFANFKIISEEFLYAPIDGNNLLKKTILRFLVGKKPVILLVEARRNR